VYANGFWFLDYDGNGVWDGGVNDKLVAWGWEGATPFVGDWNGDGRTKLGVYNKGFWFLDYNGTYSWDGVKLFPYGWDGATPLVGDWNGDGKTDVGVYNLGFWFLDYNGDHLWDNGVLDKILAWGWPGATPIIGDWNGDGRSKIGIYAGGYWYPDYEGSYDFDYPNKGTIWTVGWPGATPVIGDWNGDGKSKPGVFFNGFWYLDYNGNGLFESIAAGDRIYAFGNLLRSRARYSPPKHVLRRFGSSIASSLWDKALTAPTSPKSTACWSSPRSNAWTPWSAWMPRAPSNFSRPCGPISTSKVAITRHRSSNPEPLWNPTAGK
jgi:hypothetical protein